MHMRSIENSNSSVLIHKYNNEFQLCFNVERKPMESRKYNRFC